MTTAIFINLPVADVPRTRAFYSALGFTINETYSNDEAACVVISETIYVMALAEPFFAGFLHGTQVADARTTTEVLNCLSLDTRAAVDELFRAAIAAGGTVRDDLAERDGMYGATFADPDGHAWELIAMS